MLHVKLCQLLSYFFMVFASFATFSNAAFARSYNYFECGRYGFACEGKSRLRICDGDNLLGPSFICPAGTTCNEDSNEVCENSINYMDPSIRTVRCRRNERIADPNVPGCKGYILCIPNKNRFQGIKFKCTGNTIFNGYTRTCSAETSYKCPLTNSSYSVLELFEDSSRRKVSNRKEEGYAESLNPRTIDCKNYKLSVTQDDVPNKTAYFCPPRPERAGAPIKCTVFSNHFCILLEKDDGDQFMQKTGTAYRRPKQITNIPQPWDINARIW